jgi:hypothetical protein
MPSRGGAVASAERNRQFSQHWQIEGGEEIEHSEQTVSKPTVSKPTAMNPRRVLPNAKERDKLQKSLEEHGEYTPREIRAIKKMQYRFRCRRTNRRSCD